MEIGNKDGEDLEPPSQTVPKQTSRQFFSAESRERLLESLISGEPLPIQDISNLLNESYHSLGQVPSPIPLVDLDAAVGIQAGSFSSATKETTIPKRKTTWKWKKLKKPATYKVITYKEFMQKALKHRTQKQYKSIFERVEQILYSEDLDPEEASQEEIGYVLFEHLFKDARKLLWKYWNIERKRITGQKKDKTITYSAFKGFLAQNFFVRLVNLPVDSSIEILTAYLESKGFKRLIRDSKEFRHILKYLSSFTSSFEEVNTGSRDRFSLLDELQDTLFRGSIRLFMNGDTILVFDEELVASRSTENPQKAVSNRKAGKEGAKSDCIATLDRIILSVRYHKEFGYSQEKNYVEMRKRLFENYKYSNGTHMQSHNVLGSCDRGITNRATIESHHENKIDSCSILRTSSTLTPHVTKSQIEKDKERFRTITAKNPKAPLKEDEFTVDDSVLLGPDIEIAYVSNIKTEKPLYSICVRPVATNKNTGENKDKKSDFVLKFVCNGLNYTLMQHWVAKPNAVKRGTDNKNILFSDSDITGNGEKDSDSDSESDTDSGAGKQSNLKKMIENHLKSNCIVLTIAQRTADWHVCRKHLISGTMSQSIAKHDIGCRELLTQKPLPSNFKTISKAEVFNLLTGVWYPIWRPGKNLKTDLKIGTENEGNVMRQLRNRNWTDYLFDVGLLQLKNTAYGASADGIIALALSIDMLHDDCRKCVKTLGGFIVATNEVKSKVRSKIIDHARELIMEVENDMSYRQFFINKNGHYLLNTVVGGPLWFKLVPFEYRGQILQQMLVTNLNACCFTMASPVSVAGMSEIIYSILIVADEAQLAVWKRGLDKLTDGLLEIFVSRPRKPDWQQLEKLISEEDIRLVKSHYPFWYGVREFLGDVNPFLAGIERFLAGVSQFYDVIKGGLDGSSLYVSELKTSRIKCDTFKNIAFHGINQVMANAFIGTRIFLTYRSLLIEDVDNEGVIRQGSEYPGLLEFRAKTNHVCSMTFSDFVFRVALQMLKYSHVEDDEDFVKPSGTENAIINENTSLNEIKKNIPARNRLKFFSTEEGKRLRLSTSLGVHLPIQHDGKMEPDSRRPIGKIERRKRKKCVLCNKKCGISCSLCGVALHFKINGNANVSCWNKFHKNVQIRRVGDSEQKKKRKFTN